MPDQAKEVRAAILDWIEKHPGEKPFTPIKATINATLEFIGLEMAKVVNQYIVPSLSIKPDDVQGTNVALGTLLIHMAQWGARYPDEAMRLHFFDCGEDCGVNFEIETTFAAVCDFNKIILDLIEEEMRGDLK